MLPDELDRKIQAVVQAARELLDRLDAMAT